MGERGMRHLRRLADLDSIALAQVLTHARQLKDQPGESPNLSGAGQRPAAVAFASERESLRTRVATALAARQLGCAFVDLPWAQLYATPDKRRDHAGLLKEELVSLTHLGCGCLVLRCRHHALLETWMDCNAIPIINGCTDQHHPLQALADAATLIEEFTNLADIRITFVGNPRTPVARSLSDLAGLTGMRLTILTPPGGDSVTEIGDHVRRTHSLDEGLRDAQVVYADEIAYRPPSDQEQRAYAPYRLTSAMLETFAPAARVMHCLPHGSEIESELVHSARSLVFSQVAWRVPVTAATVLKFWRVA